MNGLKIQRGKHSMGQRTPKSKIRSPAVGGFLQVDVLFYNYLFWAFAAAASAAEWFFIAAISAAMKKDILLRVLPSGLSLRVEDCASSEVGGDVLLTHLSA